MAAPRPTVSDVLPAPSVPSLPKTEPALINYLQSLVLWLTQRLQERVPTDQASPFFLLAADDAVPGTTPSIFKITVDSAGTLSATLMILGQAP